MKGIKVGSKLNSAKATDRSNYLMEYLRDISDIKGFKSAEEEYECAMKSLNGDEKSRDELVLRNLRFVISVAKQYEGYGVPLNDLINEGNYGLVEATIKFDPSKGFKFISFAVWYVRKHIMEYLRSKSKTIRIPINKQNLNLKLNRLRSSMEQQNSREVDEVELIQELEGEFNVKNVLLCERTNVFSLNKSLNSSEDITYCDVISDKNIDATDKLIVDSSQLIIINKLIRGFDDKEKYVINTYFGLNGFKPLSLNEISDEIGITREGVRLMKTRILKKLKSRMVKNGLSLELFQF
jgi:RNA polymerase primary sigma factor